MAATPICRHDGRCTKLHCKFQHVLGRGLCKFQKCRYPQCPLQHTDSGQNPEDEQDWDKPNQKLKLAKTRDFDVQDVLIHIGGLIATGTVYNRISIRIFSELTVKFQADGTIVPVLGQMICHVFLKDGNKKQPEKYNINYDERIMTQLKNLIDLLNRMSTYKHKSEIDQPCFSWYYNGHIHKSFADLGKMYTSGLHDGRLRLDKLNYETQENYGMSYELNGKSFTSCYLHLNRQFWNAEIIH